MAVTLEDVQNQVPTLHVSLSRVGVTNVEKVIRIDAGGTETLFSAKLDCFVDLGPAPEGRAHVALRGGRQRRDRRGDPRRERVPRRDARPAHRREGARPPGRAPRRGAPRGPLPRAQARAAQRHPARRRSTRCTGSRSRPRAGTRRLDRRHRPGHDRLPVRADARAGRVARAARRPTASATTRSSGSSRPSRSRRTTSAGSARCTSAAPRGATSTSTPSACWRSSRTRCRRRSTS